MIEMIKENYSLSDAAKENITRNLQLSSFDEVVDMDAVTLDRHIEKKIGKELRLSATIGRLMGRGSLYAFFGRLFTREWIDKQMDRIN